jgi:hypothetical protein
MPRSLVLLGLLIFAFGQLFQTDDQETQQTLRSGKRSRLRWRRTMCKL